MKLRRRAARGTIAGGLAAVLLAGINGCGGEDGSGPPENSFGEGGSAAGPSESSIIAGWDDACAVHDVEAIKEFMGIRAFGVTPGEGEAGGGFTTDVADCDVPAFDMPLWEQRLATGETETEDFLAGFMYLRVNYYETADTWDEAYRAAHDAWAEDTTTVDGRLVMDERTLTGDWDEGMLFLGGTVPDSFGTQRIVRAVIFDGVWSITAEINYDADPVIWWDEQAEQVYPFTDEELASWVGETYLPQVHAAVVAAIEEGTGA
ncbi:hypothetical protein [Streptomyces sp. B6B3]|uniref:hypothetical protein n=1 Tax=Streptomyces sp. B6B3 TaxID=3153570 RepID=UPI00325F93D4